MPLIYSFIARDGVVLAEWAPMSGNLNTISLEVLQNIHTTESKFTIVCDKHTFNFVVSKGLTYLVVADEAYGRQIPYAYLARVQEEFEERYPTEGQTAVANSLDRAFGPRLKAHAEYCMKHPEDISKIAAVQQKVNIVKDVMMQNIESVMARGEKLEVLVDKTEALQSSAQAFQKKGKALRTAMWWQNCRMKLCVLSIIIVLALVIFAAVCFWGGSNCIKHPPWAPSPPPPEIAPTVPPSAPPPSPPPPSPAP